MTASKHRKGSRGSAARRDDALMSDTHRLPDDLGRNPGIGASKGTFGCGTDPRGIEGESTAEGDVMNDTNAQGAVAPNRWGRTNK